MSFLKATSAFLTSFAIIFIKLNGFVEDNVVQPDVFTFKDLNFSDFKLDNGRALSTVSYKVVSQNGYEKEWNCFIFAMPKDWKNDDTRVNDSSFSKDEWTLKINSELNEEEKKKGLVESCSGNKWKNMQDTDTKTEIFTLFFNLEKSNEGIWKFSEEDIKSLFDGSYKSSDSSQ